MVFWTKSFSIGNEHDRTRHNIFTSIYLIVCTWCFGNIWDIVLKRHTVKKRKVNFYKKLFHDFVKDSHSLTINKVAFWKVTYSGQKDWFQGNGTLVARQDRDKEGKGRQSKRKCRRMRMKRAWELRLYHVAAVSQCCQCKPVPVCPITWVPSLPSTCYLYTCRFFLFPYDCFLIILLSKNSLRQSLNTMVLKAGSDLVNQCTQKTGSVRPKKGE